MKIKCIIIGFLLLLLTNQASAYNPYGNIYTYNVYYNGILLPGTEVAKPTLKIGEPFELKINMTVYQEYKVSGKLTQIGDGYFEVVDGPSKMDQYSSTILKANESHIFEWTVKPTAEWAGGSIPINFHYSIVEKGNPEPVVNSEFTVAYCTISTEYYEGKTPAQGTSPPKSETSPESTPAFTTFGTFLAVALAASRH
ncbi:sarcinarray family MAST domain-containing protein [Methanosarcina sp. Mfa9]|uniref:sarcinarray family MAST domain-containing protein n=1 Tax=Methanosarcina sp. Mfa9 TaxID=3439063 RepID=UPI003F82FFF2